MYASNLYIQTYLYIFYSLCIFNLTIYVNKKRKGNKQSEQKIQMTLASSNKNSKNIIYSYFIVKYQIQRFLIFCLRNQIFQSTISGRFSKWKNNSNRELCRHDPSSNLSTSCALVSFFKQTMSLISIYISLSLQYLKYA